MYARAQICERVRVCVCMCACVLCAVRNAADAGAGALRAPFRNQYRRRRRLIGKVRPVSTEPPPPKLLVDIPLYTTMYMYSVEEPPPPPPFVLDIRRRRPFYVCAPLPPPPPSLTQPRVIHILSKPPTLTKLANSTKHFL